MKTGIYGGSFDPVHNGHINAAKNFMEELSLDRIIVVPAYCSPFKKGLAVTPSQHRLNMSDTVAEIRAQNPDDELYLLLGGDQLLIFDRWHAWSKIADEATIAAAARNWDDDSAMEAQAAVLRSMGASVVIVPIDVKEISSTDVREAVRRGDDISAMVPQGVAEYIWDNYLYYE